jgi:hypothetical protein
MSNIFIDAHISDDERRRRLYDGDLFVYSPTPSSLALCEFARTMLAEAFAPHDPRMAQFHLPVEEFAAVLARIKPAFIHHPRSKECLQALLRELGCDPEKTYFDVPRMRSMAHGEYLKAGIAYAFHPHRDTWYSAPFCQLNWWMPMYEIEPDNAMAFHPRYWSQAVKNGSSGYNYYEWNRYNRANAAQFIKEDTRVQPHAEEPLEMEPQVRLICPPGGIIIFSAAQMHSTVPNTSGHTRYSVDFRTVHLDDVAERRGAANVDSACTGTTMRDYLRATDLEHVPDDLVALYDDGTAIAGDVIYRPPTMTTG